jgi:hypothetical protein
MQIIVAHRTVVENAVKKVNLYFDGVTKRRFPKGIRIHSASKNWLGNKMIFFITVKKGFLFRASTRGTVAVNSRNVIFTLDLPGLIKKFTSEEEIKNFIEKELNELFF